MLVKLIFGGIIIVSELKFDRNFVRADNINPPKIKAFMVALFFKNNLYANVCVLIQKFNKITS